MRVINFYRGLPLAFEEQFSPDTGSTPSNIAVIPSTKVHVKKLSADLV
jgi:hypothetical protein